MALMFTPASVESLESKDVDVVDTVESSGWDPLGRQKCVGVAIVPRPDENPLQNCHQQKDQHGCNQFGEHSLV